MSALRSPEVTALLGAIDRLYEPVEREKFPSHLIEVVTSVVPATLVTVDVIRPQPRSYESTLSHPTTPEWNARCAELIYDHPTVRYVNGGGSEKVVKITDVITQRQFRRTAFYNDCFRTVNTEYQIAVILSVPEAVAGIAINRDLDFTEGERLALQYLRPHIARAHVLADAHAANGRYREPQRHDATAWGKGRGLTERELEVLRWISEGKRDREIAVILGASPRTIQTHVTRILHKLGVETRTTAARLFTERGL